MFIGVHTYICTVSCHKVIGVPFFCPRNGICLLLRIITIVRKTSLEEHHH